MKVRLNPRDIAPGERVVCILTGHQLKDPTATVAYHSTDQKTFDEVLGSRGVRRATYANRAIQVPNDLDEIIRAIEVYSRNPGNRPFAEAPIPAVPSGHSRPRRAPGSGPSCPAPESRLDAPDSHRYYRPCSD